jgi:hypothetical protein
MDARRKSVGGIVIVIDLLVSFDHFGYFHSALGADHWPAPSEVQAHGPPDSVPEWVCEALDVSRARRRL